MIKRKFPYKLFWQARLLNRRLGRRVIPIEISQFKKIKSTIGLHGYRRVRKEDREDVRAYRKDSYGITFMYINLQDSSIEAKTEAWGALMGVCSDFNLRPYRAV
jgi:hypothetical protein